MYFTFILPLYVQEHKQIKCCVLFRNRQICCRQVDLLFLSFQICSLGLCRCPTWHTCHVIITQAWAKLQVFAPLSIVVEDRLSWCMCKTCSTMTSFMFCTCDHRIEHMVKIPTVFSITICHKIYCDRHISVHTKAPKPVSTDFIYGLYASVEQYFGQCNILRLQNILVSHPNLLRCYYHILFSSYLSVDCYINIYPWLNCSFFGTYVIIPQQELQCPRTQYKILPEYKTLYRYMVIVCIMN